MTNARLAQAAGACAVIGGSAWISAAILHAFQPRGCVGDECLSRPMREPTAATSWLVAAAAAAMIVFLLALLAILWRSGELGLTGIVGVTLVVLGNLALVLMSMPQLRDRTRPLPGLVAVVVGLALVGWTVLRSRVIPTWAGVGLLAGIVALVGYTEQTSRVLLALPFGVAWLATGAVLVRGARTKPYLRRGSSKSGT